VVEVQVQFNFNLKYIQILISSFQTSTRSANNLNNKLRLDFN